MAPSDQPFPTVRSRRNGRNVRQEGRNERPLLRLLERHWSEVCSFEPRLQSRVSRAAGVEHFLGRQRLCVAPESCSQALSSHTCPLAFCRQGDKQRCLLFALAATATWPNDGPEHPLDLCWGPPTEFPWPPCVCYAPAPTENLPRDAKKQRPLHIGMEKPKGVLRNV